jgi:hypothetical protein
MTIFAALATALEAQLKQAPTIADAVYQAKMRPMQGEHSKDLTITLRQSAAQEMLGNDVQDFDTLFTIEVRARGAVTNGHDLLDPLIAAVNARIQTGEVLSPDVYIKLDSINYDFDAEADSTAVATLTYTASHRSTALNLS